MQLPAKSLYGVYVYDVDCSGFLFALVQHVPLLVYLAFDELVFTWLRS